MCSRGVRSLNYIIVGGAQTWHVLFIMIGSVAYVGDDYRFYYYLNYTIVNTRCLKSHTIRNLYIFFQVSWSSLIVNDVKKNWNFDRDRCLVTVWTEKERDHETKSEPIDHFSMSWVLRIYKDKSSSEIYNQDSIWESNTL